MSEIVPSIFVIANPGDRGEILAPLMEAGFADILVGDGSDETLSFCERFQPDVVVLCAALDHGDARALIAALRDGPHGHVIRIVLIGETHGPIRNALDVAELAVDRFLGRPLSPKALVFSVRTCVEAALAARMGQEEVAPRNETGGLDDGSNEEPEDHRDDDPGHEEDEDSDDQWDDEDLEIEIDASEISDDLAASEVAHAYDWDEPSTPPWRESTVILADEGAVLSPEDTHLFPPKPSLHDEHEGAVGGAHSMSMGRDAWAGIMDDTESGQPLPLLTGDGGLTDTFSADLGEGIGEDIGSDLDEEFGGGLDVEYLASASDLDVHLADLDGPPEGEGEFARALRRKMSAMAERLFPGQHHTVAPHPSSPVMGGVPAFAERASPTPNPDQAHPGDNKVSGEVPEEVLGGTPGQVFREVPHAVPHAVIDENVGGRVVETGTMRRGEADAVILIERMYRERFTGRITFRRQEVRKTVSFENGKPVFASSTLSEDRLGALLYREGKITGNQHGDGYARALESGKRMAEALVEMGYLKRRELLPVVRRHLEDLVYSIFSWDSGEYEIVAGGFATGERIRIARHPAAMILEGLRRKLDVDTLMEQVGGPATVLQIIDERQLKAVVSVADLSATERKVITSFDGERTIDEVVRRTGVERATVYQLAYGLIVMHAAQVVRMPDDQDASLSDDEVLIDRQRVLGKLALVGEADYFALLGVRRDATGFEIQRAYEAAQRDYASEMFCLEVRRMLSAEIAEINEMLEEAYRVLRSDSLRRAYLSNLRD